MGNTFFFIFAAVKQTLVRRRVGCSPPCFSLANRIFSCLREEGAGAPLRPAFPANVYGTKHRLVGHVKLEGGLLQVTSLVFKIKPPKREAKLKAISLTHFINFAISTSVEIIHTFLVATVRFSDVRTPLIATSRHYSISLQGLDFAYLIMTVTNQEPGANVER